MNQYLTRLKFASTKNEEIFSPFSHAPCREGLSIRTDSATKSFLISKIESAAGKAFALSINAHSYRFISGANGALLSYIGSQMFVTVKGLR